MLALIPLLSLALLLGAALLWMGIRGRRVDDHPVCRKCKYDLSGQTSVPWSEDRRSRAEGHDGAALCPECGRSLERKRAIRIGRRRRRPRLITCGGFVLLLALAGGGTMGWAAAKGFDWNTVKPAWMLVWQATSGATSHLPGVLVELDQRQAKDQLASSSVDKLIKHALEVQRNRDRPWHVELGNFVERAQLAGTLATEDWHAYLRHSIDPTIQRREYNYPSMESWVYLQIGQVRVGTQYPIGLEVQNIHFRFDSHFDPTWDLRPGSILGWLATQTRAPAELGRHTTGETFEFRFGTPAPRPTQVATQPSLTEDDVWFGFQKPFSVEVEVVDPSESIVELVTDPELEIQLKQSIKVEDGTVLREVKPGFWTTSVHITVQNKLPVGLGLYAELRDMETNIVAEMYADHGPVNENHFAYGDRFVLDEGSSVGHYGWFGFAFDYPPNGRLQLILRPSVEAALERPNVDRIWGKPIVIEIPRIERRLPYKK